MRLKSVRLIGTVGGDHFRIKFCGGIDFAGAGGLHEVGADVLPRVVRDVDVHGRDHEGQGEARDGVIAAHETEEGVERFRVEFLPGFARLHGGHAGTDAFLIRFQFRREIVGARRFEADFEPLIQAHHLVQLHQLRLEDGAAGGLDFFDAVGLLFQFVHLGPELIEGIIFLIVRQLEQREDFVVINAENFQVVGRLGFHHRFEQPFHGGQGLRFAVRFDDDALFGADLEQGIAGDGIERLEPAVHEDGQFAEVARVKAGLQFLVQRGQNPPRHHDDQNEGNPLFHNHIRKFELNRADTNAPR